MRTAMFLIAVAITVSTAYADKKQVRFIGHHAIPNSGGTCYIEAPHVHIYAADKLQYRDHGGWNFFVGDPVAYGYDGTKHAYKGPHPIEVHTVVGSGEPDVENCYLDGPHYHGFAPPAGPDFKLVGGAHFYVGTPPKLYVEQRPTYVGINAVYRPLVYARPQVTVEAPAGWIGVRVDVLPREVVIPVRSTVDINIGVTAPTVIIEHKKPKKWKKHKKWKN